MTYDYATQRESLFTEAGQRLFLKIRDKTHALLNQAGAVRLLEAALWTTGTSWDMIACMDRMVELGEIVEITGKDVAGQHRVFIKAGE